MEGLMAQVREAAAASESDAGGAPRATGGGGGGGGGGGLEALLEGMPGGADAARCVARRRG